jgi:hypothetical protein
MSCCAPCSWPPQEDPWFNVKLSQFAGFAVMELTRRWKILSVQGKEGTIS